MDIEKMSITELKALAYDLGAKINYIQRDLQIVNQRIANLSQVQDKPNPKKAKEEK